MNKYLSINWCAIWLLAGLATAGPLAVVKVGDTTVDSLALTLTGGAYGSSINGVSFQQDVVITHLGWQYVAYYNGARHVCVSRRQLPAGAWEKLELTDYSFTSNDAHNVISMGICPANNTIHLSFDHHGNTLHYRVSQAGVTADPPTITWSAALFGPVRNYLEAGKTITGVTYPRFWQTPAGQLQMSYRTGGSGNGDLMLVDYSGVTGLWSNARMVISRAGTFTDQLGTSTARNPYMNSLTYGSDGVLHATWCWRETSQGANHDILYAWSRDGGNTWYNNPVETSLRLGAGRAAQTLLSVAWTAEGPQIIGNLTTKLISLTSPKLAVVPLNRYYGLMNQQTQAVDPQGRIHTVMWHCTDESYNYAIAQGVTSWGVFGPAIARNYHHYWRDEQGAWQHCQLPGIAGSRPKLFIRNNGDAFLIYQSYRNPAALDSGIYTIGDLTIQAATAGSGWADWQVVHVEPGDFLNEMLGDPYRFSQQQKLSVLAQNAPTAAGQSTPLRIIDFELN